MASAAMNAAAHSVPPPYAISLGPRVRPPRLLPGTKAENTNPQPEGLAPVDPASGPKVWVQGRWRSPASNAAKDRQQVRSRQVEKALNHATHGMNIYAYRQIRTNQVVYSLTRVMQNTKILDQLIFHKKKTVPASLRRDSWRPYFSIHFPQTPAGAEAGLLAFKNLRELSLRRQLSPPRELLIATKEDVKKARNRLDPATLRDVLTSHQIKNLPRLNQLLPPKWRARKLMDQKASSVADVAQVLSIFSAQESPAERLDKIEQQRLQRHKDRTPRDRRRVNQIKDAQEKKLEQIEERQQMLAPTNGQLGLDKYSAARIALEHGGALIGQDAIGHLQDIEQMKLRSIDADVGTLREAVGEPRPARFDAEKYRTQFTKKWNKQHENDADKPPFPTRELEAEVEQKKTESNAKLAAYKERTKDVSEMFKFDKMKRDVDSRTVKMLWADERDSTYAVGWPLNVYHRSLDPKAVLKGEHTVVRQHATVDEEGHAIDEQRQTILTQRSTTPHVFGREQDEKWYLTPGEQGQEVAERLKSRREQWEVTRREQVVREMIRVRESIAAEPDNLESGEENPEVARLDARLITMEKRYPVYEFELGRLYDYLGFIAEQQAAEQEVQAYDLADPRHKEASDKDNRFRQAVDEYPEYFTIKDLELERYYLTNVINDESQSTVFSDFLPGRIRTVLENQPKSGLEERLAEVETALEEAKIDAVLLGHQRQLEEYEDPAAEDATITTRSEKKRNIEPAALDKQGLKEEGIEVEMKEPQRGVWGRIKGVFGR